MWTVHQSAINTMVGALVAWLMILPAFAGPRETLQDNLVAGKPTVLIVARTPTASERDSEAYADWAGYLNDFADDYRGAFQFLRVPPQQVGALFASAGAIKQPYAVVFFKNESDALYYDGMIHDRIVYRAAASFLMGVEKPDDPGRKLLKPFQFKLRAR
jgi:hypothetical protein